MIRRAASVGPATRTSLRRNVSPAASRKYASSPAMPISITTSRAFPDCSLSHRWSSLGAGGGAWTMTALPPLAASAAARFNSSAAARTCPIGPGGCRALSCAAMRILRAAFGSSASAAVASSRNSEDAAGDETRQHREHDGRTDRPMNVQPLERSRPAASASNSPASRRRPVRGTAQRSSRPR